MQSTIFFYLKLFILFYNLLTINSAGSASWYYRGSFVSPNTTYSFNVGDSLLLKCLTYKSSGSGYQGTNLLVLSSNANVRPTVSVTSSFVNNFITTTIAVSSGTLIYVSILYYDMYIIIIA